MSIIESYEASKPHVTVSPSDRACYVCGCARWKEIVSLDCSVAGNKAHHKLYRCLGCSLEFVSPFPSPDISDVLYDTNYYSVNYLAYEKERKRQFTKLLDKMSAFGIEGPILDVGCGAGLFTAVARDRGFDVCGVEPSQAGRATARQCFGIDAKASLSDLSQGSFRTAVLWQVLAHVPNPVALLRNVCEVLQNDAYVIMSFCNWRDVRYRFATLEARLRKVNTIHIPTILWRFREQHLTQLAAMAGLRVERFVYETPAVRRVSGWKRSFLDRAFAIHRVLTRQDQELHVWCRKG